MLNRKIASSSFLFTRQNSAVAPASAWILILSFSLFSTLCIVAGAGGILNILFPASAFAVSVFLYFRSPALYVGFSWWICFLSPLVRRLADYRGSYTDPSPILLTPYLVLLVTLITCWKHLMESHRTGGLPFVLSLAGVLYGLLVGMIFRSPFNVAIASLEWFAPILFGFHLFVNWGSYPLYRQTFQRTFSWGVLVMGGYGIIQYLLAPEWDRIWLINAKVISMGSPEPLGIRVWSTLNSPEPFAAILAAGLLLSLTSRSVVNVPASVAGYLAFLLTQARSAWIGWLLGLLNLIVVLDVKLKIRLMLFILMLSMLVVPLTSVESFSEVVNTRIQSFSDVENDGSVNARRETYKNLADSAMTNFLGDGIARSSYDSAVLSMFLNLGWLGTLSYGGGILLLLYGFFQGRMLVSDPFLTSVSAVILSVLVRFPVNTVMLGASGMVLWGFLGIGLAGKKYHIYQKR